MSPRRPCSFISLKIFKNAPANLAVLWQTGLSVAKPESDYLVLYDNEGRPADRFTWKESKEIVEGVAKYLVEVLKVKKGDRLGIAMRNWPGE